MHQDGAEQIHAIWADSWRILANRIGVMESNSEQKPAEVDGGTGRGAETLNFLSGGGEMGALMRSFDWSRTPLGAPETWSSGLRTTVRILLANGLPMLLWWGPEYISIYNDAYRPILGAKHPWGLGKPGGECWSEIWNVLKPLVDAPFQGGPATWIEDIELVVRRSEFAEETHFTVAYSPVPDETAAGGIGGVLATVHEITGKVVTERRVAILRELGVHAVEAKTAEQACVIAARTLAQFPKDIPFALLYILDPDAKKAKLAAAAGTEEGCEISPPVFELQDEKDRPTWPLGLTNATAQMQFVENLSLRFAVIPPGPWPDPPRTAVVVPIHSSTAHQLAGFLVAGISSYIPFDEQYRSFLEVTAGQIASAIVNARAYEEERKRAEALAEIDRAKTAFFSNVSHEFRTPLTLLLGPLEDALAETNGLPARYREQLEIAHRNSLRLMKLVNSLLDFSRIEAGRIQAAYEPVDLASMTAELASTFRSTVERAGLKLKVDCPQLSEAVYVDPEMWEKIVLNLLSNAFKFTFDGEIEVSLRQAEGSIDFAVRDTGIGIAPNELPHLFERFHRVKGARGRSYEGSGIGLALVQELVKLHGGLLRVESEENRGSVFRISIPLGTSHLAADRIAAKRNTQSTATRAEAFLQETSRWFQGAENELLLSPELLGSSETAFHRGLASHRPRVLIAEDNADMREYVQRLLGHLCDITPVADGWAALESAREQIPDLVLTDVMMPRLDGFALLRELRADARTREVSVILLSARAGEESRIEGLAAGADDYLVKPFSAKELLARVESCLKLQRVRREAEEGLRQSEQRFRALVTATSDVIYRMSPDWGEMHDLEDRNFIVDMADPSRAWLDKYVHPDDQAHVTRVIHEAISSKSVFEIEHRVLRKDGTLGWTFSRAVPVLDDKNEILEWFGAATDITERKRQEEELRRTNADLEQFAYSASHDLQEPLRGLLICSQLLTRRYGSSLNEQALELLSHLNSSAKRMEMLVRDLLAYTQVIKFDTAAEIADSNEVLKTALANLNEAATESGAAITFDPLPPLHVHSTHLQQLFQNLIGNAIKYRSFDRSPVIHVGAERRNANWVLSVKDNGIGIDPEYKEQIFGVFKRLHTSREYSGTGIGLAICQRIVERYRGRIWVESQPNQGSTFLVALPI